MAAPESPHHEPSPLVPGQILVGKYRVEREIGRGGMGVVLAATHLQLEHLVAIKVLRRDLLEDDRALARLLSEARASAKIRSEHVARVLDVGTLESGSPFIVMEYLEGEDLADLLDRFGALDITQAVQFLLQTCEALAQVHAAEMIHRDLKPGNLFIARLPDGSRSLKIVDFGISKHIGGAAREQAVTTSAQVLGSPYYMPPEQMRAEPVDERSDIWSLGAILFEMLTARPPFLGETLPEVYAAVLGQPAPLISSLRVGVPAELDDVVQRCLDKDPGQRFGDVADLAEALAPFGGPLGMQSVERITRILTNPDLFRSRSLQAGKPAIADVPSAVGTARGGIGFEPALPGMPMLDVGPGALSAPAGEPSELSPALVTPAQASYPRHPGASSAEFRPLSATGSTELEGPRSSRGVRAAWASVALVALLVGGGMWLARGSDDGLPHTGAAPLPVLAAPVRDTSAASEAEPTAVPPSSKAAAGASAAAPLPSPMPNGSSPGAVGAEQSPEIQTQRQALRPAPPRPVPMAVGSRAVPGSRHAVPESEAKPREAKPQKKPEAVAAPVRLGSPAKAEADRAESPRPEKRASGAAASTPAPRRDGTRPRTEDPWNPSSFGDRH